MLFPDYYDAALRLGWFDPCFYFDLLQVEGLSITDTDLSLFEHYATIGWRRGLSPSDRFSVPKYLSAYRDVADSQQDPLYHYLARGRREQREAFALFDPPREVQFIGWLGCHAGRAAGDAMEARLALAQAHGIAAFCVPYEAGRGRGVLDRLAPDTPFCLFLDQRECEDGAGGDGALFKDVLEIMADPRQIRVRGKPLLVVDRPERLEEASLTLELWRQAGRNAGLGGLFVAGLTGDAGSREPGGLDAHIEGPDGPAAAPRGRRAAALPMFPGFLAEQGCETNGPEAFRGWLASAAAQTMALSGRNFPQLVFVDAHNGWVDGADGFVRASGATSEQDETLELRRFAHPILVSSRLPVLFLCDGRVSEEQGPVQRLIASLGETGGIACFSLIEADGRASEHHPKASVLRLSGLEGSGWSRAQVEALAGFVRARRDLVVVSTSPATADLLGLFAAHGCGTVSFLPDRHMPADAAAFKLAAAAISRAAPSAHRIIVDGEAVRDRISAACAIPAADIQVLHSPGDAGHRQDWRRYGHDVRRCLLGLGNEGRRIRLTGSTLGRQEIAGDLCVVIPSYNHRQFIVAALDSILAQSVRPKEIRIIDDGSDDGSAQLVRGLASEELGIFVQARENRGAPATINEAVAATACPIVAVMNSDDRWHPLRIEELVGELRRPGGADLVFSRVRMAGPEPVREYKRDWYERGVADYMTGTPLWLALMFCNFFFTTSNLIARRERFLEVGGIGPLRYCHDLDYMLKAIFAGHKVRFVEQTLCEYRIHAMNTIDRDVENVVFEEAWIVVKFLRQSFGRIREEERLAVAQRILDKKLAGRVLAILRATAHNAVPVDDSLVYSEPHLRDIRKHGGEHHEDVVDARKLLHDMMQLIVLSCDPAAPGLRA
jgi:glycosyltransferase involved in cell wall biosynthesis